SSSASRMNASSCICAAERIRTSDPRFRRPMLYPAELQPQCFFAEREGFEPSIELLALYSLSKRAPSASRPSLPFVVGSGGHPLRACASIQFSFAPAEEEGFEPPALSRCGFQDRRLRPLGHSSKRETHVVMSRASLCQAKRVSQVRDMMSRLHENRL